MSGLHIRLLVAVVFEGAIQWRASAKSSASPFCPHLTTTKVLARAFLNAKNANNSAVAGLTFH
jgi:hypothetical protein